MTPQETARVRSAPSVRGDQALLAGDLVGRFRVEELLGQGGMGAVYRAWDPVLERSVALKAVRLGEAQDPGRLERFRREALALAQLNHPSVCQVHDWVEWQGSAYIAIEHIEGRTLAEAAGNLDRKGKLQALRAIASALAAAHAKGIVHRDLKPANVMVDDSGRVKVLDFGLARLLGQEGPEQAAWSGGEGLPEALAPVEGSEETCLEPLSGGPEATCLPRQELPSPSAGASSDATRALSRGSGRDSLTQVGAFVGSPGYASPEQMLGRPAGPQSDLFSLGIVAWELLLGEHPFPGEGRKRMEAIAEGRRRSLRARKLPRKLTALLEALLEQDPARRPTAPQVEAILDRMLAPVSAARWTALAVAGLLVLLGGAYLAFGRSAIADLMVERPPRVAVMPIRNESGEPALDAVVEVGMTELLGAALRQSPRLTVVDAETVSQTFRTFKLDPSRALEGPRQAQMARAMGARLYLQGRLRRRGTALVFDYALLESGGRVRVSGSVQSPSGGTPEPYALVEPAARELLRRVDPLRGGLQGGAALPPAVFERFASGKALLLKGDFKGSEPLLREAASKAPAFPAAVFAYASTLRRLGRPEAEAAANWALMASRAGGDRFTEVRALGVKAYLARDRGNLEESERLRLAALELAQAGRDTEGETINLNHLGLIAAERGRPEEARGWYERSLTLATQLGDRTYESFAVNNLANLALRQGDLARARERYLRGLQLQREAGNRMGEALALNNLGVVALTRGDTGEAERFLGEALAIREAVGDQAGVATCLRNLGLLRVMRGELEAARDFYVRGLEAASRSGIKSIEAECRFCLGELSLRQGKLREAEEDDRACLALLAPGQTPDIRGGAQAALAECAARLSRQRLPEARALLEQLEPACADSPYAHRARAWIRHLSGDAAGALEELAKAQADPERQAPEIQGELAKLRAVFAQGATEKGGPGKGGTAKP